MLAWEVVCVGLGATVYDILRGFRDGAGLGGQRLNGYGCGVGGAGDADGTGAGTRMGVANTVGIVTRNTHHNTPHTTHEKDLPGLLPRLSTPPTTPLPSCDIQGGVCLPVRMGWTPHEPVQTTEASLGGCAASLGLHP